MDLASCIKLYIVLETKMLKLPLYDFLKEVLSAGVSSIQLRDKECSISEKIKNAEIIREVTLEYNALFIVNDSLELALNSKADGLHMGIHDGDIKHVRDKAPDIILGYSCNNLDDAATANKYADYAGIGPYTNTNTKKDIRQILGAAGIYKINNALNIPAVAIGGININNAADVLTSKVAGIAVSSFLCASKTPYSDAVKLMDIINERV